MKYNMKIRWSADILFSVGMVHVVSNPVEIEFGTWIDNKDTHTHTNIYIYIYKHIYIFLMEYDLIQRRIEYLRLYPMYLNISNNIFKKIK